MKWSWASFVMLLSLLLPSGAFGLSCARPSLDKAAVDAAIVIFEGTAGAKRSLDDRETAIVQVHGIKTRGGSTDHLKIHNFTVTRSWKGAMAGQSVDVLINSYWGDDFAEGEAYLVVSPQRAGNLVWSPLCRHTIDMKHAALIGNLAVLEKLIGKP